jgi:hypothetical protein
MIVICSKTHVARLKGREITAFLLNPADAKYQRWWKGTHLAFHPVRGSGQEVGDLVYMDEFIGARRVRMTGAVTESIPGKKITWQFRKGIRLPLWLSLELADDEEGVAITHTLRAGFEGAGSILDPLLRLYLSEKFARAMDDHVKTEFAKLEGQLHTAAPESEKERLA